MESRSLVLLAAAGLSALLLLPASPQPAEREGADWSEVSARLCQLGAAAGHWLGASGVRSRLPDSVPAIEAILAAVLRPCQGPAARVDRKRGSGPPQQRVRFRAASNLLPPGRIMNSMDASDSPQTIEATIEAADPSDASLVLAARGGEQGAYSELYRRHAGWLLPTLWRLTGGDRHKAEDLLQDAFVKGWEKLGQLREPAAFGGWMKRLAVNLALADRRRLQLVSDQSLPEAAAPEPPWPAADRDLERAIARLPQRARQVLVLFHLEGFAHEEIAALMKVETGTTKAQLHRARGLLKEMLS